MRGFGLPYENLTLADLQAWKESSIENDPAAIQDKFNAEVYTGLIVELGTGVSPKLNLAQYNPNLLLLGCDIFLSPWTNPLNYIIHTGVTRPPGNAVFVKCDALELGIPEGIPVESLIAAFPAQLQDSVVYLTEYARMYPESYYLIAMEDRIKQNNYSGIFNQTIEQILRDIDPLPGSYELSGLSMEEYKREFGSTEYAKRFSEIEGEYRVNVAEFNVDKRPIFTTPIF